MANRGASSQDSLYRRYRKKPVIAVRETERIFIKEDPLGPPTTTFEGIDLASPGPGAEFLLGQGHSRCSRGLGFPGGGGGQWGQAIP